MKIIFLDVDGVLNHANCPDWQDNLWVLDPECVQRVREICEETDSHIVLTSTWRLSTDNHHEPPLSLLLQGFGKRLIGKTPNLGNVERREEIAAWLREHPDVTQFVVLDDDGDASIPGHPFTRTSFEHGGLTADLAEQTKQFLRSA